MLDILVRVAYAGLLGGMVVGLAVGIRTNNWPAVVNAVGALVVAVAPVLVEHSLAALGFTVAFVPALSLALGVAGLLHVTGMLGWYDTVTWWDHLTHTVSATILAAVVHASLHTVDAQAPGVDLSEAYIAAFTLLFVLSAGVLWELLEIYAHEIGTRVGAPPVLEYYGLRDTALDLVFNAVGAVLVIVIDIRSLGTPTEQSALVANLVLGVAVAFVFCGSLALGAVLEKGP